MALGIMTGATLTLYNSLTRALAPFTPIDPANVRVYSCGPTVYNYAHIGNLRAYVFTDTLSRVLTWKGYALTHIINITDVGHLTSDADAGDDKMEAASRALPMIPAKAASTRSRASATRRTLRSGANPPPARIARWNGIRPGAAARRAGISNAR